MMYLDLRLDIEPYTDEISPARLEELSAALRRNMLQFVFENADAVGIPRNELNVNGAIKLIED